MSDSTELIKSGDILYFASFNDATRVLEFEEIRIKSIANSLRYYTIGLEKPYMFEDEGSGMHFLQKFELDTINYARPGKFVVSETKAGRVAILKLFLPNEIFMLEEEIRLTQKYRDNLSTLGEISGLDEMEKDKLKYCIYENAVSGDVAHLFFDSNSQFKNPSETIKYLVEKSDKELPLLGQKLAKLQEFTGQ